MVCSTPPGEYASRPEVKFDPRDEEVKGNVSLKDNDFLKNVDPAELQYVYRFACGLNLTAAEKNFPILENSLWWGKICNTLYFRTNRQV